MDQKYLNMDEDEIISSLLIEYADDKDAVELINRAKQDLPYLHSRHEGQTPMQHIMELVGLLETWF